MDRKFLKYIFLITVIFVAACIETDIYLPAFADMMHYFSTSEEEIQKLLTWNFIGICVSGPLYGPISDAIGRKKPLYAALGMFFLGSLITVFAQSFDQMLWGRLLQGLGSGGCFTLGTAIIFDAFQKEKAIKAISHLNSTIPFTMALAPLLGGYLNNTFGFLSNFLAIALFVALSLAVCFLFFEETLEKEKRMPLQIKKVLNDFKEALTCLPFWKLTLGVSFLFAGYIGFLSFTAVLFVVDFGISKKFFPFYQAAILIAWLLGSMTFNRALAKWGAQKLKNSGVAMVVIGGIGFVIASVLFPRHPQLLTLGMLLYSFGCNWIVALYFPESMELLPHIKGVTASLLTSARLLVTAVLVGIVSAFYNTTIFPLTILIACITIVAFLLFFTYEKRKRLAIVNEP
jgi:DHA1 family bicyclomycin/chloramphenicol resistance-like MFS transporter